MIKRTGNKRLAVVGWGRGMGHKGHMYLASSVITQAQKMSADAYFFVSKTVGKDDPIFPEEKVKIYQKVFPQQAPIFQPQGNLNQALTELAQDGYQGVVLVVGADQKDAFKYLERPNKEGVPVFQSMGLKKLRVISRQETGDTSAELEGPRATPMREVLLHPDATEEQKFKVWRDAMPDALGDEEVMDLMKKAEARLMGANTKKTKVAESRIMDRDARVNAFYVSKKGDKHRVAENIPYYLLDKLVPLLTKKYSITMNDIEVRPADQSQYRRTSQPELTETGMLDEFQMPPSVVNSLNKQVAQPATQTATQSTTTPTSTTTNQTTAGQQPGWNSGFWLVLEGQFGKDFTEQAVWVGLEKVLPQEYPPKEFNRANLQSTPQGKVISSLMNTGKAVIKRGIANRGAAQSLVNKFKQYKVPAQVWDVMQQTLAESMQTNPNEVAELLYKVKPEIFSRFGDDFVMDAITQACEQHTGSAQEVAVKVVEILKQGVAEGAPIVVMPSPERLKKAEPTKVRYQGDIVPPTKPPSTEKRGVKGRPGQRPMPQYEQGVAEGADPVEDYQLAAAKNHATAAKVAKQKGDTIAYHQSMLDYHANMMTHYFLNSRYDEGEKHEAAMDRHEEILNQLDKQGVAEEGITRRGILKGIAGAGALGAAGKASAIAGAFPTPSHQAAMYKAAADSNRAMAAQEVERQRQANAARASKLAADTKDVERLNKVNYHGKNSPKPTDAEWDGDSDFLYLDGTQYAKASRMPISGDVPSDLTLVSTKEGRQVYLWTRRSLKGTHGRYFYPAEKPSTINEFAPGNGDDGLPHAEYQVYQCNPEDQFDWIGGPLYQTDSMGMAHKYAYEKYVKHRPKAFMVWQEHTQGSRGNYGVKGESDHDESELKEDSQVERKITRIQSMIQDFHNRAKATKNDIKKNHYLQMADQLSSQLDSLINDANEQERDGNMVAQHDAEPSDTWNRGGLAEDYLDEK